MNLQRQANFILPELMAIAVAHEVRDDDIVFAGTGLPMVGIMAANHAQCAARPPDL